MSRSMWRNAAANFVGGALPAVVLLVTTPLLLRGLGTAGYGAYVVLTSLVGYLSVMDINFTSGSVKFMAAAMAQQRHAEVAAIFRYGAVIYACIGLVGTAALLLAAPLLASWLFPAAGGGGGGLPLDATGLVRVAALAFLSGQLISYLVSVPQAAQRYDLSGRFEMALGSLVPLACTLAVVAGGGLLAVMWLRNGSALLALVLLWRLVRPLVTKAPGRWPSRELRGQLLAFSGYAYLTRLAGLSYQHFDKLLIAALLGAKAVAIFAVPVTLANRLFGMTYRVTQVLFPLGSALLALGDTGRAQAAMLRSMRLVFGVNACATVLLIVVGRAFLQRWAGDEFAGTGYLVLVLVAAGALADSLTNAPSLITDASGMPAVTGAFALSRAIVGLGALTLGAHVAGVAGVAAAHLLMSITFGLAFLIYFSRRVMRMPLALWWSDALRPGLASAGLGCLAALVLHFTVPDGLAGHLAGAMVVSVLMGVGVWCWVFQPDDRCKVKQMLVHRGWT